MKKLKQYVMKDIGVQWIGQVPEHWIGYRMQYITRLEKGVERYMNCLQVPTHYFGFVFQLGSTCFAKEVFLACKSTAIMLQYHCYQSAIGMLLPCEQ